MKEQLKEDVLANALSVEAWFAQPHFKPRAKGDDIHVIEFHIPAAEWERDWKNRLRNEAGTLVWVPDESPDTAAEAKPEKPTKQEKGPHGQLWRHLRVAGFVSCPGVREMIAENRLPEDADDWATLRRLFAVESLSMVDADQIIRRFPNNAAVATMVAQAQRKVGQDGK